MKSGIIAVIIIVIIGGLFFLKIKGTVRREKNTVTVDNKYEAEKFVNQLDKLGYFKYTDNSDIDSLKTTFIKEYDLDYGLTTIWDDKTNLPKDFRYYFCDGEDVFEEDGIIDLLKDLKPVFDKMNFKCEITDHIEEWNEKNKWLNHKITINGTEYIIFKNFKGYGWGEAPFRIAQILNTELQKQNIVEQIYLVNGGNDGKLALLTKAQYQFIYKSIKNENWKPLEINEWAKVSKLDIKKFDYWNK